MAVARRASSSVAVAALVAANLLPLAGVLWWGWSVFEVLLLYWLESGVVGALNVPKILLAAGDGESGHEDGVDGEDADPESAGDGDDTEPTADGDETESGGASSPTFEYRIEGTEWIARQSGFADNVGLAAFFVFHYGVFWVVHGVFVFALPLFALGGGFGIGPGPFDGSPFGGPFDGLFGIGPFGGGSFENRGLRTSPTLFLLAVASLVVSHGVSFVVNYLRGEEYRSVSPDQQMKHPYDRVTVLHLTIVFGAFLVASLGSPLPALVLLVALKTGLDLRAHLREHRGVGRGPEAVP